MSKLDLVDGWSCDERNRAACRNPHGCHCREITALRAKPARGWQNEKPEAVEYRRGFRAGWDEAVRISSALSRPKL